MLTNKITGFSADLLNTVRGILGEAKKCPADCECEKCEAEDDEDEDEKEMKEGSMPTADEPTDANKKTAQKIRDMMAKEKKPVKEHTNCGTPECCGQCDTAEQIDEATAKIVAHLQKRYGDNIRKSHVRSAASDFGVDASKLAKAVRTKLGKTSLAEDEQIDEVSKATLGRYINKAKDSIDMASYRQGHKEAHGSSSKPLEKKLTKRHKGISTAVNKLTKEDAEQIDEAGKQHIEVTHVTGQKSKKPVSADNAFKALNHYKSLSSTKSARIVSEDAEQIDELSTEKLLAYRKKAREADTNKHHVYADEADKKIKKKTGVYNPSLLQRAKAKLRNEESEQIDELSKGTMGRYINKAATKMGSQGVTAGLKIAADEKSSKNFKDMGKREKGIKLAVDKLTKEEQDFIDSLNDADIEQIDELSKDTMLKYLSANKKSGARGGPDTIKRMRGTDMAVRKYTARDNKYVRVPATEETEITEARGRPKKAGAKDFTIHPKTKEKLMHNNPEHMAKIERLQKNKVLDKPKVEAGQHIMNQLSKAKTSMLGGSTIHFTHGDSKHVSGVHAAKLLTKYAGMKPSEKEDFQKKIGHSHEQLMKHV